MPWSRGSCPARGGAQKARLLPRRLQRRLTLPAPCLRFIPGAGSTGWKTPPPQLRNPLEA